MAKPKKNKKQKRAIKKSTIVGPGVKQYKEGDKPIDLGMMDEITLSDKNPNIVKFDKPKAMGGVAPMPSGSLKSVISGVRNFPRVVRNFPRNIRQGVEAVKNFRDVSKVKKIISQRQKQLRTKEGLNRLTQQELSRNPKLTVDQARVVAKKQIDKLSNTKIIVDPKKKNAYLPQSNTLVLKQADNAPVASHELTHAIDAGLLKPKSKAFSTIKDYAADASIQNRIRSGLTFKDNLTEKASRSLNYFKTGSKGREATAFLSEARQHLLNKKFLTLGKDGYFNKVTPEMLKKAFNNLKKNPSKDSFREGTRIFNFIKDTPKNFKHLAKEMNSLPVVAPIVGGSIYSQVKPIKRKKQ